MLFLLLWLSCYNAVAVLAQAETPAEGTSESHTVLLETITGSDGLPSGSHVTYLSYPSTITVSNSRSITSNSNGTNDVDTASPQVSTSSGTNTPAITLLAGFSGVITGTGDETLVVDRNATTTGTERNSTSTSTSAQPTNTQPCNNFPEFCERRYSNITEVCAHNSPFFRKGSAASNQELGVISQLNDGIRMCKAYIY